MNKKQRNRKIVAQNNRNRMINRRYTSTIKTLSKLLIKNVKNLASQQDSSSSLNEIVINTNTLSESKGTTEKGKLDKNLNNLYRILDKAVKKGIVHKNTAARKKSRVIKFIKFNIKALRNSQKS